MIFEIGNFTFSSGIRSPLKMEGDKLTDDQVAALALLGSHQLPNFGGVISVPKGKSDSPIDNAERLADALMEYSYPKSSELLIVDDVWSTGASMEAVRKRHPGCLGWVAFAWATPAPWVTAGLIVSPTVGLFRAPINQR